MFLVLLLQSIVITVALVACWFWMGLMVVQALAFGAVVALVNSGMLAGRWYMGLNHYHCNGERHLKSFHRSSLERFIVVSMMLGVGFAFTSLAPQPMLVGFIVGQLAWAFSLVLARRLF